MIKQLCLALSIDYNKFMIELNKLSNPSLSAVEEMKRLGIIGYDKGDVKTND